MLYIGNRKIKQWPILVVLMVIWFAILFLNTSKAAQVKVMTDVQMINLSTVNTLLDDSTVMTNEIFNKISDKTITDDELNTAYGQHKNAIETMENLDVPKEFNGFIDNQIKCMNIISTVYEKLTNDDYYGLNALCEELSTAREKSTELFIKGLDEIGCQYKIDESQQINFSIIKR